MKLDKLLKPRSIAIVGASEKPGFGGDTTRNFYRFTRKTERVYLVHPKYDTVLGHRCYHTLEEIEDTIDLVVICTNQKTVLPLLDQAAAKGCRAAVVFASGYGETGAEGKVLQQELVERCGELDIALMGPNCAGFANYVDDIFLFAFETEERERRGSIGMISQSGQIVLAGLDLPGTKFSYVISSGNSANVTVEDYIDFLVDDPDTKVVAAYYEGVKKPEVLVNALEKAAKMRKPVVILKTGRSAKSKELASSHTGSLSGSDAAFRAILRKYGAIEAEDLEDLFSIANAFAALKEYPEGDRYVFMNVSGGEAGVTADLADLSGIRLAELTEDTRAALKEMLPSYATVNNPLDMTASLGYDSGKIARAFRCFFKDPGVDCICMAYTITPEIWDTTVNFMVEAIQAVNGDADKKPIFWLPFIEHTRHRESAQILEACGVPLLFTGKYGIRALSSLNSFMKFRFEDVKASLPERKVTGRSAAFSEYDSKQFLADNGVKVPPQEIAASREQAAEAAGRMGYPVALKVHSADIMHKSDVGGVKLNLRNADEVMEAYTAIMAGCGEKCPDAVIEGVLVSPMLKPGIEVIVGVNNDPQFGPMLMAGLGGVFVEIFKDVQLAPVPLTKKQALDMIYKLKGSKLLNGYRGGSVYDVEALAEFLVSISDVASRQKHFIKELDINPVFVTEDGVEMADALLVAYQYSDQCERRK